MAVIKGLCAIKPTMINKGTDKAGIQTSGPPTMAIKAKNIKTKGMSASNTNDADEKKSRKDSKSRMELANVPTDCG